GPRAGEIPELLVDIPQLEVDPPGLGQVAQLIEGTLHVVDGPGPPPLGAVEPRAAESNPWAVGLQGHGHAVMVQSVVDVAVLVLDVAQKVLVPIIVPFEPDGPPHPIDRPGHPTRAETQQAPLE